MQTPLRVVMAIFLLRGVAVVYLKVYLCGLKSSRKVTKNRKDANE